MTEEPGTFVAGVEQTVYYSETIVDGVVTDNHLMTVGEYDNYVSSRSGGYEASYAPNVSYGSLTITLMMYDIMTAYDVRGGASWSTEYTNSEYGAEKAGRDYLSITWGGNGALYCNSPLISGSYADGTTPMIGMNQSNNYVGYCWMFKEKNESNKVLSRLTAQTVLQRTNSTQPYSNETLVQLTYVHTYSTLEPTFSFETGTTVSSDGTVTVGFTGGVSFTNMSQAWQIQTSIPRLMY